MKHLLISLQLMLFTVIVCAVIYPAVIWTVAQIFVPYAAEGWLLRDKYGRIKGSEIIAQPFSEDKYFWPRPSAADFNAAAAGGSNFAPTNPVLEQRAGRIIARFHAVASHKLPADLVTASGSGLDPHITLEAALYQTARIAAVRKVKTAVLDELVRKNAVSENPFGTAGRLINVLMLNDKMDLLEEQGKL